MSTELYRHFATEVFHLLTRDRMDKAGKKEHYAQLTFETLTEVFILETLGNNRGKGICSFVPTEYVKVTTCTDCFYVSLGKIFWPAWDCYPWPIQKTLGTVLNRWYRSCLEYPSGLKKGSDYSGFTTLFSRMSDKISKLPVNLVFSGMIKSKDEYPEKKY